MNKSTVECAKSANSAKEDHPSESRANEYTPYFLVGVLRKAKRYCKEFC
jgi:hypothetical protein